MADNTQIDLVYIAGSGRSGSTLLERALGQFDEFTSIGELRHIWRNELDFLCGCGTSFRQCDFWNDTFDLAFGGLENIEFSKMRKLQKRVDRVRFIPLYFFPNLPLHSFESALSEYKDVHLRIYSAIHSITGKRFILDSSKDISYLYILSGIQNIRLHILHVVRDSRGVAYSWNKRPKLRPEVLNKKIFMPQPKTLKVAIDWVIRQWAIEHLPQKVASYTFVKYDDFILSPTSTIQAIQKNIGFCADVSEISGDGWINLSKPNHTVSGNPIRFISGKTPLKMDIEWQNSCSFFNKMVVTFITLPYLRKYKFFK